MEVSTNSTWELGFYSPQRGEFGTYDFLPFGLAPSPGINDKSLKEVLRLASLHTGVHVTDFVDDLLGQGSNEEAAWVARHLFPFFWT